MAFSQACEADTISEGRIAGFRLFTRQCDRRGRVDSTARRPEARLGQRVATVEFDSIERATAAYDSEGHQTAFKALGERADRDPRIAGECEQPRPS
ncbi:MAG: hypothetical protein ACREE9_22340 [Stellaceae bacterium]